MSHLSQFPAVVTLLVSCDGFVDFGVVLPPPPSLGLLRFLFDLGADPQFPHLDIFPFPEGAMFEEQFIGICSSEGST